VQIAISSASLYPQLPTETALVNIAAMGCRTVEVFLQTRSEYKFAYVSKLSRLCRRLGLKVHSLHAASAQYEPMLFYRYRRQNLDGAEILKEVHQAAAMLGAKYHVFHGPLKAENLAQSQLAQGLCQAAESAAWWGIKLALENVSWCAGWSPGVFEQLNSLKLANLYYTFDSKQAMRSGFEDKDYIQAMGGRLVNVHVSKGNGELPDDNTEFSGLVAALAAANYKGPVMLEVYGSKVPLVSLLAASWQALKNKFR
jgi:sugar phosphate isomerase/epimerase